LDLNSYLEQTREALLYERGFVPAEPHLPAELRPSVASLLVNRQEEEAVLLALIPAEGLPGAARLSLMERLSEVAERFAAQGSCLLLCAFVFAGSLQARDVEELQEMQLNRDREGVRARAWVVDLETGLVALHEGPPGGLDGLRDALAGGSAEEADQRPGVPEEHPPAISLRRPAEPRVTYLLLGAVLALFGAIAVTGGGIAATQDNATLIRWGAAHRPSIWLEGQWWRLASAALLHWGPIHLLFNGLALYQLGRLVEWLFGHWRYALILVTAALAGSALSLYLNIPFAVSAGASGGLYGLFGALLFFRIASPLGQYFSWQQILVPIGINFLFTITIPNIDAWNHLGGMAGGFLAAAFAGLPDLPGATPRFALPARLHIALSGLLVAVGLMLVTGLLPVGGPARSVIIGINLLDQGRPAQAEPLLRQGVRRWEENWLTHYLLAVSLAQQGKLSEARSVAEQALTINPRATPARELLQQLP
jgi:membrane associated rhomboid family serine protease